MSYSYFYTQELLRKWESLPFSNNFIFSKVMQDENLCRHLLELLLDIKISRLEYPKSEVYFKENLGSHGIRLDVYTSDGDHYYDVEIQTVNKPDLLKRARYYSSIIDADVLRPSKNYNELKENIIIFLCLEDPFNKGLPLYTYKTKCLEDASLPDDETTKLFYNISQWKTNKNHDIQNFFHFILTDIPTDDFTKNISSHVSDAKKNADFRRLYMTIEMEMQMQIEERANELANKLANELANKLAKNRIDECVKQEQVRTSIENAVIAVKEFSLPAELVAEKFNVPLAELKKHL